MVYLEGIDRGSGGGGGGCSSYLLGVKMVVLGCSARNDMIGDVLAMVAMVPLMGWKTLQAMPTKQDLGIS